MNRIVNKFLLAGDKFMPEMHLKQTRFTYSASRPFTKNKDKVLRDKAFNIAKNPKYDGYQRGLASMVYKFLDKKSKWGGVNNKIKQNQHPLDLATHQLAEELHKPIVRNFKNRTIYFGFKDNIWVLILLICN